MRHERPNARELSGRHNLVIHGTPGRVRDSGARAATRLNRYARERAERARGACVCVFLTAGMEDDDEDERQEAAIMTFMEATGLESEFAIAYLEVS
jgi:hypothetical protein